MEIYHDMSDQAAYGEQSAEGQSRPWQAARAMAAAAKVDVDKENEGQGVRRSGGSGNVRGLGVQHRAPERESGNVVSGNVVSGNAPEDGEDLKAPRPVRSLGSRRTVLEDVTHRYNSSSTSTSSDGSEDMAVDRVGAEEDVESRPAVGPSSRPARVHQRLRMKRSVDKSYTRRMR